MYGGLSEMKLGYFIILQCLVLSKINVFAQISLPSFKLSMQTFKHADTTNSPLFIKNKSNRPDSVLSSTCSTIITPSSNLSTFVSTFLQKLQKSEILCKIFHSALEVVRNRDLFLVVMYNAELDVPNPYAVAKFIVDNVESVIDILTASIVAKTTMSAIEDLFHNYKLLTAVNASQISRNFADKLEREGLLKNPESVDIVYMEVLVTEIITLFDQFHILNPESSIIFAKYLSEEFSALKG